MSGGNGKATDDTLKSSVGPVPGHPGLTPWQPGQSGNPKGRPKRKTFGDHTAKIDESLASAFPWSKKVAEKLGFDPDKIKVGELTVHAAKEHALKGNARYLTESLDRTEGKVKEVVHHEGHVGPAINIAMFPVQPPEDWYKNVRKLIGHRPGDPLLPGEVIDEGAQDG